MDNSKELEVLIFTNKIQNFFQRQNFCIRLFFSQKKDAFKFFEKKTKSKFMFATSPIEASDEAIQNWEHISPLAQKEYNDLKQEIQKLVNDNGKAKFCKLFGKITRLIEDYIAKDESGANERALICGYLYIGKMLAINTRQLMHLVGKCKSSINSGFQAIGYKVIPMDAESAVTLMKTYPFLKNQISLTRQWTLRSKEPYVQETEKDIQAVLTRTLAETPLKPLEIEQKPLNKRKTNEPVVSLFNINTDNEFFLQPPSGASSAYTTPTPYEQEKNAVEEHQQEDLYIPSDSDFFNDSEFFSLYDQNGYYENGSDSFSTF